MNSFRATGRQQGRGFSLGAAALDFPQADECAAPLQLAPDLWQQKLVRQAHPEVLTGLHRAYRAGRDLVADHIPLYLDLTRVDWYQQLSTVQKTLISRGSHRPSKLRVRFSLSYVDSAARAAFTDLLTQHGQSTTEVYLHGMDTPRAWQGRGEEGAQNGLPAPLLPAPAHLPRLTQIRANVAALQPLAWYSTCQCISQYVPQLTTLDMRWGQIHQPQWAWVVNSDTDTLTDVTTDAPATDELVQRLLTHAPRVVRLGVGGLGLVHSYGGREWRVEELCVTETTNITLVMDLPRSRGTLRLSAGASGAYEYAVGAAEGFDSSVFARLPTWQLNARLCIAPAATLLQTLQPDVIENLTRDLQQLSSGPHGIVELQGWHWTSISQAVPKPVGSQSVSLQAVPPAGVHYWPLNPPHFVTHQLQSMKHVKLGLGVNGPLTDDTLGMVCEFGSSLHSVSCTRLEVQRQAGVGEKWIWGELRVTGEGVGLVDVTKLPCPSGPEGCLIRCNELTIDTRIDKMGPDALRKWLRHVEWAPLDMTPSDRLCIRLDVSEAEVIDVSEAPHDSAQALYNQILILRALRLRCEHSKVDLVVQGCRLSLTAMAILRGLPGWGARLFFAECSWPLRGTPEVYDALADCVPSSYTHWSLSLLKSDRAFEAIYRGVQRRREAARLPPIAVVSDM